MTPDELMTFRLLSDLVGEYRERVMKGRITGDLLTDDCQPYMKSLAILRQHKDCGRCGGTGEVCYSSTSYGPCPECKEAM